MTRKVRRRQVLRGIGATGIAGLAGCTGGDGGDGTDTSGGSRTIQMGILMGVTGALAELGPPIRDAAQLAGNIVDEESDTFSVDMQFEDTETNPNTGISGAEALINAGYPMIAGALSSSVSIQVAKQQTVPNGVVQCSPASTSPAITDLDDNNYMWRTPPTDALQSQVMADVGINRLENSTVSTFALNNDYGQGLANAFVSAWEDGGGTVQQEVSFEKAQSSYSSKLSTAMQDDPDMLMVVGYPESGVQIFRDFYSDYSQDAADVIVPDGLRAKSLPGDVGNSMRNVWGTAPKAAGPGQDYFADQFGGDPSAAFASQSFDAAAVLMLANAAAGENNGEAIRDEMMNVANPGGEEVTPESLVDGMSKAANGTEIQYKGVSGPVDFDENGDMKAAVYELFRYQEGGLESTDEIEFSK